MASKTRVEHGLRLKAKLCNQNVVVSLAEYRANKAERERLREEGRLLDSLKLMSGGLSAQLVFTTNFQEMDRCFNQLLEMGAIPAIRFPWQAEV